MIGNRYRATLRCVDFLLQSECSYFFLKTVHAIFLVSDQNTFYHLSDQFHAGDNGQVALALFFVGHTLEDQGIELKFFISRNRAS